MIKFIMRPVVFDGITYMLIAVFGYLNTAFGGEEAVKYLNGYLLFWLKLIIGTLAAATLAIKMYRSTTFSDYKQAQNGSFHGTDPIKPIETKQNEKTTT